MSDARAFEFISLARTRPAGARVRLLAEVRATSPHLGLFQQERWAALLVDATGEVPAFDFDRPPPVCAWVAVEGVVSGWTAEALDDPELREELTRERGFFDLVEIVVDAWAPSSEVFG